MPKVLIVDDTPDNIKLLRFCLDDDGYEFVIAGNGLDALEAAREHKPHTILLDIMMPGIDGIEVCRRLRNDPATQQTPIILVTALTDDDDVIKGLDAGADDYVTKPFNGQVVAARTRSAVQRFEMVLENEKLMHEMQRLASTDSLTRLLNRRTFFNLFEHAMHRARRSTEPLSCVMIDVDFFKRINDEYGHLAGDLALIEIAKVLSAGCRDSDVLCRYGGEEFAVLLPDTDTNGAVIWAERRRKEIGDMTIRFEAATIKVSASFGVAQTTPELLSVNNLINSADQSLLEAKLNGRDRVNASSRRELNPA